jgi:hypothetical protein
MTEQRKPGFQPGQSGNPSGYRLRVAQKEAIRASLLLDYDWSRPSHAMQLDGIVEAIHDSTHARKRTDRVRAANLYKRQLRDIPKRQALLDGLLP